jgi:hypothetical protein
MGGVITMKDNIDRVANAICNGASNSDIHDLLIEDGMSEEEAYLTFIAGKLLAQERE